MTPDQLIELARGFQSARIFLSAVDTGLLPALAKAPAPAEELAAQCGTRPEPSRRILDALCSVGVAIKTNGRYELDDGIRGMFEPDNEQYHVDMFRHMSHMWDYWSSLSEIAGKPLEREDEGERRDFIRAMANIGLASAKELATRLDLSRARKLLDAGGGPGVYAITLAEANPEMEAVVFDQPEVLEIAEEFIRESKAAPRLSTRAGNAVTDDFGTGYDAVLMSNFVHVFGPDQNKAIFEKAHHALNPGGQLIVKDFLIDADRTAPEFSAVFSINMLVATDAGDVYTEEQLTEWMREAGFADMRTHRLARNSAVIVGQRV